MSKDFFYQVFLAYNSKDRDAAEKLARWLKHKARLRPFFDQWDIIPGDHWMPTIEKALKRSRSCALLIGPHGTSPWSRAETQIALIQRAQDPEFRVIPVLLPGITGDLEGLLPSFVQLSHAVELRDIDDPSGLRSLAAGIRGKRPGRRPGAGTFETSCPFRGLEVFEEEHSRFFFGREPATRWLLQALQTHRFLAVVGPSGSGKSSLVRAGFLAELGRGAIPGSERWPLVLFRPGQRPLEELALAFTRVLGQKNDIQAPMRLMDQLAADRRQLHFAARMGAGAGAKVVLVIDQFEEVFTRCSEKERRSFLEVLLHAISIEDGPVTAVVTLRADFYGRCASRADLAERFTECQLLVSPMNQEELRRAIEQPARLAGLEPEPGLIETLLEDLGQEPGALPLLQHTLLELWRQREGTRLTSAVYRRIGGVRGAIAHRAEAVFASFGEDRQLQMRRILLRLTQPGEGTEDTRRRVSLTELLPFQGSGEEIEATLQVLASARLLTLGTDERGEPTVDIAHEALIRHWDRLRAWIDASRDALRIHRRLTEAADEWKQSGLDGSYLYTGARLAAAEEWAAEHGDDLSRLEREFLETSRAQHEERQQRELSQAQALLEAERQRVRDSERLRLNALALALAVQATQVAANLFERGDLSAVLALQSYRFNRDSQGFALSQVDRALRRGLSLPQLGPEICQADSLALSPDGGMLATADSKRVIKLWNLRCFQLVFQLLREEPPAPSFVLTLAAPRKAPLPYEDPYSSERVGWLGFSPNGRLLAALEGGGTLHVWDLDGPESPRASLNAPPYLAPLVSHRGPMSPSELFPPLCFSPDSRVVALGGEDGVIRLWDVESPEEPPRILARTSSSGESQAVVALAFRPDGSLVAARRNGSVETHDPAGPSAPASNLSLENWRGLSIFQRSPHYRAARYSSVAFSPDASLLAEGASLFQTTRVGEVRLWRLVPAGKSPVPPLPLKEATSAGPSDVTLGPGNRFLAASTYEEGTVIKLWDLERPASHPFLLPGGARPLAFSPDGRFLACGGGSPRIWRLDRPDPTSAIVGRSQGPVEGLAFGPEGTVLAVRIPGSVQVYDLRHPETEPLLLDIPRGGMPNVTPPVFSGDGRRLALNVEKTLRVWDLQEPQAPPLNLVGLLSELVDRPRFDFLGATFEDGALVWLDQIWSVVSPTGEVCLSRLDLRDLEPGSPPLLPQESFRRIPAGKAKWGSALAGRNGRTLALLALREDRPQPWLEGTNPRASPLFWSVTSLAAEGPIELRQANGRFRSFAVSDSAGRLAAGNEDRTVVLWDCERPESEPVLLSAYQDAILALAFSPDGSMLAGGGNGATVQLWDLRQPSTSPVVLEGHQGDILAACFSPDGRFLATGDRDGIVRIWIAKTETLADLLSRRVEREMTEAEWRQFVGRSIPRAPETAGS